MIRENANETIPINSFQQQAQMNLSYTTLKHHLHTH